MSSSTSRWRCAVSTPGRSAAAARARCPRRDTGWPRTSRAERRVHSVLEGEHAVASASASAPPDPPSLSTTLTVGCATRACIGAHRRSPRPDRAPPPRSRMRRGCVDEAEHRHREFLGLTHQSHRLAIALGWGMPKLWSARVIGSCPSLTITITERPPSRAGRRPRRGRRRKSRSPRSSVQPLVIAEITCSAPRALRVAGQLDSRNAIRSRSVVSMVVLMLVR